MAILETGAGPVVRSPAFGLPLTVVVALIPVAFAVVGLVVRYLAYAAMAPDASLAGFPVGVCRMGLQVVRPHRRARLRRLPGADDDQ